jgi:hypothetical protein
LRRYSLSLPCRLESAGCAECRCLRWRDPDLNRGLRSVIAVLFAEFVGGVAQEQLLQHPDHRLSPARCRDQQALEESIALLRRELLGRAHATRQSKRRSL